MKPNDLMTCSECGNPIRLKKHKPYCDRCGYLTANGRKVLAPSPEQIVKGAEEERRKRKYPVGLED